MMDVRIEVLYFDGCPSYQALVPRLRALMTDRGLRGEVETRRVESVAAAAAERFLGSPTLRIDGRDVEPGADERSDYGMKCRLYRTAHETAPIPPDEWITAALDRTG